MATQEQRRQSTRQEILAAATKIIASSGYQCCSISSVAKETSVTTGAVQYHFKSKDELLRCMVTEYIFADRPWSTTDSLLGKSIPERVAIMVNAMWSYYGHEHYSVVWEVILGNRNNKALLDEISSFFNAAERTAEADVKNAFLDLSLTSAQAKELIRFVSAHLRGTSLLTLHRGGDKADLNQLETLNTETHQLETKYLQGLLTLKLVELCKLNQV